MLKAELLEELRHYDQAFDLLDRIADQHSGFHHVQLRLAKSLVGFGKFDQALTQARLAFDLAPRDAETLRFLSSLPDLTAEDRAAVSAGIADVLKNESSVDSIALGLVHFAAAGLARRDSDIDLEMQHLTQAHGVFRHEFRDSEAKREQEFHKRVQRPLPDAVQIGSEEDVTPIFVVGLPRSGTTLVERVLAAHSQVEGLGELISVERWAREKELRTPVHQHASTLRESYLKSLPDLSSGTSAFVDKMPGNYAHLGVIAQAFPNAVLINVQRDPRDIALSMWREYFGAEGMYFTHDMKWMANEANRYCKYIDHWSELLPGRILNLSYENLVSNFEEELKKLTGICNLSFEDGMLSPHVSKGHVKTASVLQVRQPVSTASVGRWRATEAYLSPFVDRLDTRLWQDAWQSGP
ncbi:MAG: sulfotransferase [Pseudomonadota bacterium]